MTKVIDVTGLNPQQIAMIEEIVTALKMASKMEKEKDELEKKPPAEDDQLKQLHEEFSWLVTDLGVKKHQNRSQIYDLD